MAENRQLSFWRSKTGLVIMLGFLLKWPAILTMAMFPLLVWMYVHLAHSEERDAHQEFGLAWERYAVVTPGWLPHWGRGNNVAHGRG